MTAVWHTTMVTACVSVFSFLFRGEKVSLNFALIVLFYQETKSSRGFEEKKKTLLILIFSHAGKTKCSDFSAGVESFQHRNLLFYFSST